ncbi:thioredoxin family protein [Bacteroidia bacterium]|nr:thioredoxin family protein [Bacteroidia bacterium]
MKFNFDLTSRTENTYLEYRDMIENLLAEGKTTGNNHSEEMIGYTYMNVARMNRLDKKAEINDNLSSVIAALPPQKWLVISEAWCGDAAQNLPWLVKMSELNSKIELSIVLRDDNIDIIDAFLTNGGRSIPKLIALNESNEVLFDWGPRPNDLQKTFFDLRREGLAYSEISKTVHTKYSKDKGQELQKEFLEILSEE